MRAASNGLSAKPHDRSKVLRQASADYFPKICMTQAHASGSAILLHPSCLSPEFANGPLSLFLKNLDVAAYMYGQAIEKEFKKNNFDPSHSKRFMLNYYLGAAIEFESRNK